MAKTDRQKKIAKSIETQFLTYLESNRAQELDLEFSKIRHDFFGIASEATLKSILEKKKIQLSEDIILYNVVPAKVKYDFEIDEHSATLWLGGKKSPKGKDKITKTNLTPSNKLMVTIKNPGVKSSGTLHIKEINVLGNDPHEREMDKSQPMECDSEKTVFYSTSEKKI